MHEVESPLRAWESFYVIVGSSAGALTGLQFVVMTLIAGVRIGRSSETLSAFGTPNVVHFCAALLISALLSAPWGGLHAAALAIGVCGIAGLFYSLMVVRRTTRQSVYQPVFEDWLWHNILPVAAYLTLFIAGLMLERHAGEALLMTGAVALLLIFIGIHNAWDTVTYLMLWENEQAEAAAPAVAAASPAPAPEPKVEAAPPAAPPPPATPPTAS